MELPAAFQRAMEALLGEEYPAYLASLEQPPRRGLRRNPLKCSQPQLEAELPFALEPTPFSPLSFSFEAGEEKVGRLPAHHAGLFYVQEPSACSAVTVLAPQPGEKVLDLCAAPGGKSTQIAGLLAGEGLLWSNEIVKSRAQVLLSNVERLGVANAVVSSCHPQRLCESLQGFFDKVLVDAPCSGEGMFRRDPAAIAQWTPESPAACAQRQRAILDSAALAVREGGVLVYSTCTFSQEENEDNVRWFLSAHPEFALVPIEAGFGRPGLENLPVRRIYPMDLQPISPAGRRGSSKGCLRSCLPVPGRGTPPGLETGWCCCPRVCRSFRAWGCSGRGRSCATKRASAGSPPTPCSNPPAGRTAARLWTCPGTPRSFWPSYGGRSWTVRARATPLSVPAACPPALARPPAAG